MIIFVRDSHDLEEHDNMGLPPSCLCRLIKHD